MLSAFGVDHGDFSKGLKPQHLRALNNVIGGKGYRYGANSPGANAKQYSIARVDQHTMQFRPHRADSSLYGNVGGQKRKNKKSMDIAAGKGDPRYRKQISVRDGRSGRGGKVKTSEIKPGRKDYLP